MEQQTERIYDDEINLYDYLKVIYKRKLLIIAICLASVIAAMIISYRMTPLYQVSAMLSLSFLADKGSTTTNYSVPIANLIASIEGGSFNRQIYEALNLDPASLSLSFKVRQPKSSTTLQVDYFTSDPAQGKLIVDELLKQVSLVYGERALLEQEKINNSIAVAKNSLNTLLNQQDLIKSQKTLVNNQKAQLQNKRVTIFNEKARILNKKKFIDNQKERILNDKETLSDIDKKKIASDMELEKRKIILLKESEKTIKKQIEELENNTRLMMEQRTELLRDEGKKMDAASRILYLNSIQQNMTYLDRLNSQIDKNKTDQEVAKANIEQFELKLKDKDAELRKQDILLKDKDNELTDLDTNLKDKDTELSNLETDLKNKDVELLNLDTNWKDKENEMLNKQEAIKDIELSKKTVEGSLYIIQPAVAGKGPVKPEKRKIVGIAGAASFFLGIFLSFFVEYSRRMQGTIK